MATPALSTTENCLLNELVAARGEMTKSGLAQAAFGEVTASTQSMVSRATTRLKDLGLCEERREGRNVLVKASAAALDQFGTTATTMSELRTEEELRRDLERAVHRHAGRASDHPYTARPHADDRLLHHLHHASLCAAREFLAGDRRPGDREFAHMLTALADDEEDPTANRRCDDAEFLRVAVRWPSKDADRAMLVEAVVRFQDPVTRGDQNFALMVVRCGQRLRPGSAEAYLWLPMAVGAAWRQSLNHGHISASLRDELLNLAQPIWAGIEKKDPVVAAHWRAWASLAISARRAAIKGWGLLADLRVERGTPTNPLLSRIKSGEQSLQKVGVYNRHVTEIDLIESERLIPGVIRRFPRAASWLQTVTDRRPMPWSERIREILDHADVLSSAWSAVVAEWRTEPHRKLYADLLSAGSVVEAPAEVTAPDRARAHCFLEQRASREDLVISGVKVRSAKDREALQLGLLAAVENQSWSPAMVLGFVAAVRNADAS